MLKCTFRDSTHIIKEIKFQLNTSVHCLGTRENVLRIWDIFTKKCMHTLEGHTDQISVATFSPNGNIIMAYVDSCGTLI